MHLRRAWGVHSVGVYRSGCHFRRMPSSLVTIRSVHQPGQPTGDFGHAMASGDSDMVLRTTEAKVYPDDTSDVMSRFLRDRDAFMQLLSAVCRVHNLPSATRRQKSTHLLARLHSGLSSDTPFLAHLAAHSGDFFPHDTATIPQITMVTLWDDALRIFLNQSYSVDTDLFSQLRAVYQTLNSIPQLYGLLAAFVRSGRLHVSASAGLQALGWDIEHGNWSNVFAFLDMWSFDSRGLSAADQARIEVTMICSI
jgi:hypothetical protein